MAGKEAGTYRSRRRTPLDYTVDDQGKIVGGYNPTGPNNWGRWGADDRRGTANLITPAVVRDGARLVTRGKVISLSLPINDKAPRWAGRPAPKHYFTMTGSDGVVGLPQSTVGPGVTYTDDYIDMALQS